MAALQWIIVACQLVSVIHNANFLAYSSFQKLPLIAVEESLRYLQPPWDQGEPGLCKWLGKVYQVQSAVESILISQQDESFVQNKRFTYKTYKITHSCMCYHDYVTYICSILGISGTLSS